MKKNEVIIINNNKNNEKSGINANVQFPEKLVYIDFEAVSVPLANDSGLGGEYPYAYSAAIYREKEISTFVYEGNNTWQNISSMKMSLLKYLNVDEQGLNKYRFVGWNGGLEKNVLRKMFGDNFKYADLMLSDHIFSAALDDVAATDDPFELGFEYTRSFVNQKIKDIFIKRKKGKLGDFEPKTDYKNLRSGAIACLVGAIKYGSLKSRGKKWITNKLNLDLNKIDLNRMTQELYKYSKKDVQDMIDISDNPDRSVKRYNFLKIKHIERQEYKKGYSENYGILKKIDTFYKDGGDTHTLLNGYTNDNGASYLNRAYNRLGCDELDADKAEEVKKISSKYKDMDIKEISKLKDMLIKENIFNDDFAIVFKTFSDKKQFFKIQKDKLKLEAKNQVKFIK